MPPKRKTKQFVFIESSDDDGGSDDCFPVDLEACSNSGRGNKRKSPEMKSSNSKKTRCTNKNKWSISSSTLTLQESRRGRADTRNTSSACNPVKRGRGKRQSPGCNQRKTSIAHGPLDDLGTSVNVLLLCSDNEESELNDKIYKSNECITENANSNIQENQNSELEKNDITDEQNNFDTEEAKVIPLIGFDPTVTFSDSDSDDIYSVNHEAIKEAAQATAVRLLQEFHEQDNLTKQQQQHLEQTSKHKIYKRHSRANCNVDSDSADSDESSYKRHGSFKSPSSSPEVSSVQLSARKMFKISKKTLQLLEKAEQLGKNTETDCDISMNQTVGDELQILSEEDTNPIIEMKVKYGLNYTKVPIRKREKFGMAYQTLAELHGVRFDHVVLSLHDTVLSPDQTPTDVQLSIADIVECGIIRMPASTEVSDAAPDGSPNSPTDPSSIQLKLQCNSRRGIVYMNINKYEKLSGLMQRYAQSKGVDMAKFRFMFDGEKLDSNETPVSLDLEGGECIDVYPV